jgi:hypothetical protein
MPPNLTTVVEPGEVVRKGIVGISYLNASWPLADFVRFGSSNGA